MAEVMKYLVPALAVAILIGMAGYYYLQSLQGKLMLVQQGPAAAGQDVYGRVELLVKKSIDQGVLTVRLIGEEITTESRGDRDYEGVREFFRKEQVLEGPRPFLSGEPVQREFQFPVPPKDQWAITVDLTEVVWRLEASFNTGGIDLYQQTSVTITE